MRRALAVLLLLPALAVAQPSAADSALVADVVRAIGVEESMAAVMGPMGQTGMGGMMGQMFNVDAIEDSLAVYFLADLRPDALRAARDYYSGPTHAALLDLQTRNAEQMSTPAGMMAFQQRMTNPKKGALADEALTRRYVRALGYADMLPEMMERMFEGLANAVPELAGQMEAEGGLDAALAQMDGQIDSMMVVQSRVALADLPDADLAAATAFYESDAGQYTNTVTYQAVMDVMIPGFVEFMSGMAAAFSELEDAADEAATGESDVTVVTIAEDAGPTDDADGPPVFEVVEQQPEMIGGIEALAAAVVYPEAARREGVEGQVVVRFVVDTDGSVIQPVVLRSPDERLSEAALAAVRSVRFTPGMQEGEAVRVRFAVPVTFRLRDDAPAKGKATGH